MRRYFFKNLKTFVFPAIVILLVIIASGLFFTSQVERHAKSEIVQENHTILRAVKAFLEDELREAELFAQLLATSPYVQRAFDHPEGLVDQNALNYSVDRYTGDSNEDIIAYIMDDNGKTIASSNRHERDSFVGKGYAFRPYFQEAMRGKKSSYFAIGSTSAKRGFYASSPIYDNQGNIRAVAVIKRNLDLLEAFLIRHHHVLVADRHGVIFLSSFSEFLFKSLYPIPPEEYAAIKKSKQYADYDFYPLYQRDYKDGEQITLFDQEVMYFYESIPKRAWRIVALGSLEKVMLYRLTGITLTVSAALIFLTVFVFMFLNGWGLERVQEQRDRVNLYFDFTPSAIFTIDKNNVVTSWNRKAEEITGYAKHEILGKKCNTFSKKYCKERCELFDAGTKKPFLGKESRIITKDGEERIILRNADILKNHRGKVIGVIESFEDITDRKVIENALKESEERYAIAMESINEGLWDYNPQTEELFYSPSWYTMLGYRPYELPATYKTWQQLVHPEDLPEAEQKMAELLEGKTDKFYVEIRMRHKDGSWKWIMSRAKTVEQDRSGLVRRLIGIHNDITKRKQAEHEREQAILMKAKFTATVSHELRAPLGPIKEGVSIILDGITGDVNQQQRELLGTVKRNADRLNRLINEVLDYQKLETGTIRFFMEEHSINDLVKETQDTMKLVSAQKKIFLDVDLEENMPMVKLDRDKILQVLTNYVNNAIKFTDKGGVTIKTWHEDNVVKVAVIDTGSGIRDEDIDRLFRSFEQLETPQNRKFGGTGLGLAISKEIVAKHGGKVWAESVFGKGSTFYFLLPVKERRRR